MLAEAREPIQNDGHIVVNERKDPQEDNLRITGMESHNDTLNIGEEYVGPEGTTLKYFNSATVLARKHAVSGGREETFPGTGGR
ncbi:MAG: hypothetical protein LBJ75_00735 [Puniceicoccales bacterium]|jgi:hypothetical protein|nr:hypothetical protein [Puniceicoccales bacterium]